MIPVVLICAALACAGSPVAPQSPADRPIAEPATASEPSAFAALLTQLGNGALTEGDPETARQRFERAIAAAPADAAARAGLGRALVALGRDTEARTALEAAIAADANSVEARLGLAEIAARTGDGAAAEAHLARAVELAPARPDVHERYAALTGPAPPGDAGDAAARIASAERHPYDPAARLAAGEALLARGDPDGARAHFETALVLADLDPDAAQGAVRHLRATYPDWKTRRVIPVHALVDEVLRADPAWHFQIRLAWVGISQALAPLLDASFVVTRVDAFRSAGAGFALSAITAAARAQHPDLPADGILFVATGRPAPKQPGAWKAGEAELLGRVLAVRLARGEVASRVLAHEVIHLFGGVHVSPEVDALMNPSGTSRAMDPWNAAILRATRGRVFGPGGIETNVLAHVDLDATIEAYRAALRANVALRNAGIVEALGVSGGSVRAAAPAVRDATRMDEHLGDVASFLAQLLLRDGQPGGAARMWDAAAQLYPPGDTRARIAARNARALAGVR